jgi:acyl dehydratase
MEYSHNNFGKYFEEFCKGDIHEHFPSKTITESDNNLFCLLTMNHHPLHLDEDYAAKTIFKKRVVVGTYIVSLVVGMSVPDISGKAIANLDYEQIAHHAPVFIGDTIHASSTILDVRESKTKPNEGIIFVETKAYNQNNELVLTLKRHILVPKK